MHEDRQALLVQTLRKVQRELEELGFAALLAPVAMPQGYSVSLMVGESEQAIVAAYTSQSIGAEFAHSAEEALYQRFSNELADNIASRAISSAAARPE